MAQEEKQLLLKDLEWFDMETKECHCYNQEEKELLLKDLSARLPYGLVVHYNGLARPLFGIEPTQHFQITLDNALDGEHNGLVYVSLDVDGEEPKPYLRPMSSMTEEEKEEIHNLLSPEGTAIYKNDGIALPINHYGEFIPYKFMNHIIQYLLKNHFDFMGLIPKGLAIEVTEVNNPYKE